MRLALKAAARGSAIAVPGIANKLTVNLARVSPRSMVRKVSGRMFKKKS